MAYTDIDKPSDYFTTKLYSGNGGTQSITGLDFAPNWVWTKGRSGTYSAESHKLYDTVRGTTKELRSDVSNAESTNSTGVTSFNSDGYALGADGGMNGSSTTYVSWNWKAGTSVSGNTTGSGTAKSYSGSVNTDAGFSIIKYIGNDNASQTVPHHLGATPSMVIVKNLDATVDGWMVYHTGLTSGKNIVLNSTDVPYNATASGYQKGINGIPTSTNLTFVSGYASQQNVNGNNVNYIGYCFAEKTGYSKFGSYTGNGNADGTFVYTGFKPAFMLVKKTSGTKNWYLWDGKRASINDGSDPQLYANLSNAEDSGAYFDILSNGFKNRNSGVGNDSGGTYIYMAFAESPFVTSSGIPTTGR